MTNKKKKGFTIVELVIVIAVIAILAAVLIPTFSSIINKANESADIQAVRQMNMALMAESAISPPETLKEVIKILSAAGYNAEDKLIPVSKNHGFYWSSEANMITLIRDEGNESPKLIFPTEETAVNTAFEAAKTDYREINFGSEKAVDSDKRTFFDLGEKEAKDILEEIEKEASGGGGGNGGSGGPVTTAAGLIAALETGGDVTLGASIEITEAISIPSEATATINLDGHTLTLGTGEDDQNWTCSPISVSGTLTITGSGNSEVEIATNDYYAGIHVQSGGTLNLTNVSVDENVATLGIQNEGSANFTNVNFNVEDGIGLFNLGDATITNGEFVANGEQVLPISNGGDYYTGGTVKITGTKFSEGSSFVSYNSYSAAPIYSYQGAITLAEVTVTTGADIPNVSAWSGASVTVESGTFNDKFMCVSSSVTVKGGTFGDKTFAELYDEATTSDDAVKAALCCYNGWTLTRADNVITLTRN